MTRSVTRPKYSKPSKADREYLDFVRWLPCFICFREVYQFFEKEPWAFLEVIEAGDMNRKRIQETPTEAAHLGLSSSRRGVSQKYPANESGPLCRDHHRESKDSHHAGTKTFWERHGIDRDWIVGLVRRLHEASLPGKIKGT